MGFTGKIPANHLNMRTEFSWMFALNSDHFNIHMYETVHGYDAVFIIFPKGASYLNAVGVDIKKELEEKYEAVIGFDRTTGGGSLERDMTIYSKPVIETLKKNNGKVIVVQEGPTWFFNEYDVPTQFNFYNQLAEADLIFAHNEHDTHFYKGLFPRTKVSSIPSLMIINPDTCPWTVNQEDTAIIGGNFCHWYGGFQSYIVASDFQVPIYVPASHCKRKGEEQVPDLHHLPWVFWTEWMKQLATFKYAVNMMPTVAAGTFSMNCAYFRIPCIGNEKVDTQISLFPELSVDVDDVHSARHLALKLRTDKTFYEHNGHRAKYLLENSFHYNTKKWLSYMEEQIYG